MSVPLLAQWVGALLPLLAATGAVREGDTLRAEIASAKVSFLDYCGPATFSATVRGNRELVIEVDPRGERGPLHLRVVLPSSAEERWAADVVVVDATGRPLLVRRSGTEWHKLTIRVPPERATYIVRAVQPPGPRLQVFSDRDRQAVEPTTGLKAAIATWHEGRKAALSIRFDDSHPSHLATAIPVLREFGFRGTFMVCPGRAEPNSRWRSDFQEHLAEWKAVARRGDQEFANHTAHHRGASGDEEMEAEIGQAAKAIWDLFPGRSKLLALNLGGGTSWETTKPLRYYLDKYHLFDASSGSLGMDDVYGNRVAAFREHLRRHIERGLWCRIHFHAIGQDSGSSEATFRATLATAKANERHLWIAGMADIYKYQTERQAAKLELHAETPQRVLLKLCCGTDPHLYDQPLTIELVLPTAWPPNKVKIIRAEPHPAEVLAAAPNTRTIRLSVPPLTSSYTIERSP